MYFAQEVTPTNSHENESSPLWMEARDTPERGHKRQPLSAVDANASGDVRLYEQRATAKRAMRERGKRQKVAFGKAMAAIGKMVVQSPSTPASAAEGMRTSVRHSTSPLTGGRAASSSATIEADTHSETEGLRSRAYSYDVSSDSGGSGDCLSPASAFNATTRSGASASAGKHHAAHETPEDRGAQHHVVGSDVNESVDTRTPQVNEDSMLSPATSMAATPVGGTRSATRLTQGRGKSTPQPSPPGSILASGARRVRTPQGNAYGDAMAEHATPKGLIRGLARTTGAAAAARTRRLFSDSADSGARVSHSARRSHRRGPSLRGVHEESDTAGADAQQSSKDFVRALIKYRLQRRLHRDQCETEMLEGLNAQTDCGNQDLRVRDGARAPMPLDGDGDVGAESEDCGERVDVTMSPPGPVSELQADGETLTPFASPTLFELRRKIAATPGRVQQLVGEQQLASRLEAEETIQAIFGEGGVLRRNVESTGMVALAFVVVVAVVAVVVHVVLALGSTMDDMAASLRPHWRPT